MSFWVSMKGDAGEVVVPSIGAVVGTINQWSLRRSEESIPGTPGMLTLQASFSYVNSALMNESDLTKHVLVTIRRGKHYRVCGDRMAFDGTTLVMEGASLCPPE
jgi:hypothetical protein